MVHVHRYPSFTIKYLHENEFILYDHSILFLFIDNWIKTLHYGIISPSKEGWWKVSDEIMTLEEQKQVLIDTYINLMRIKAYEQGDNKELEYQIKTTKVKLSTFGIDITELEY